MSNCVVRSRGSRLPRMPVRQHVDVQTLLRYVNSTIAMLYHLRAPALLMRAHALATVREWKKRLEHPVATGSPQPPRLLDRE